jgi:acyl-CoA synthetase (AMP-forming)/AMP-acid ligase II
MVLFTSGSTGPSKAAVITHRGLARNALATAEWQGCTTADVIAGTISMFHCFAILHTVLGPFLSGAGVVAQVPFSPSRTIQAAADFPPTIIPGTPAMFELLLEQATVSELDWRALRFGCSGGSPLRPETQARFMEVTGAPLLNGYGMTEATSFIASPPIAERNQAPHSMGYPVSGVSCRIAGGSGEAGTGELEVGGVSVMAGYLSDPDATREVLTPDGWLRTGDRVRISNDGELFYVGRIKNIINRGGEKIHPELVEGALAGPQWLRNVVAVGVPDHILGERVAVVVEASDDNFDESELRDHAEHALARHERPEWYIRVDAMPRTATGKLSLTDARALAHRQLAISDGDTALTP